MYLLEFLAVGIVSWLVGAGLNYLADVLPVSRSFSPAVCRSCQNSYRWQDYLFLRKCKTCRTPRQARAWIVQFAGLVGTLAIWYFPPRALGHYAALIVFFYFGLVFIMDVEHRVILHSVSIAGAALAIPLGIWQNGWLDTLIGGVAGFGIMLALYYFGELFRRVMARARGQEIEEIALGFGDVNLTGVLGLMLGWPRITACLFAAIILGGLLSGAIILIQVIRKRYSAFTAIPYAPFLLISAAILFYLAK